MDWGGGTIPKTEVIRACLYTNGNYLADREKLTTQENVEISEGTRF